MTAGAADRHRDRDPRPADPADERTVHPIQQVDDELLTSWALLSEAYLALTVRLAEGLAGAGHLTLPQFDILLRLVREPGHTLPLGRIAADVGLTAIGLVKLVNRMELDGLLVCESLAADRDTLVATITGHGHELTRAALTQHLHDLHRQLLAPLGVNGLRALDILTRTLRDHQG